jgi:hypothetical protein
VFWNNIKQDKLYLISLGGGFVVFGVFMIFNPVFWFKAAYVDFTGYNIQVGAVLIIIGMLFIGVYFRRPRKR